MFRTLAWPDRVHSEDTLLTADACALCADIVARLKRHQGYNVLHPIGFDAFGLPAEQFAIQTGNASAVLMC